MKNPAPASGGADRQTVASAKLLAPESLRALTRTVAREDFEINAHRLPGVSRAVPGDDYVRRRASSDSRAAMSSVRGSSRGPSGSGAVLNGAS